MRRFLFYALLLIAAATSCKKDELVTFSTDLAINNRIVRVADSAGSTRVLVYADESWKVRTEGDASWVTLDKEGSTGNGEFLATVQRNAGNLPRSVKIVISSNNKTDTINLQQRGIVAAINILDANANGIANGGFMKTAITTNVPFNLMKHEEVYNSGGTGWITGLTINGKDLNFTLSQNLLAESREALIRLSYKDALGTTVKDSILVTQNPKGDYDLAVLKDFAYVKTALANGVVTEDIYIEGVVVSDKGNPNMGLNANKASNKHEIDKTENAITVYLQSMDGKSGFLIRTKTGGDNIYGNGDVVKLWLKGINLRKENNPGRTILEQVQSVNIISKTPGD
jgi:hypothetical protein